MRNITSLNIGDTIDIGTEKNLVILGKYSFPVFTGYVLLVVTPAISVFKAHTADNVSSVTGMLIPMNTTKNILFADVMHHTVTDVAGHQAYSFDEKLDKIHTSLCAQYSKRLHEDQTRAILNGSSH